jgi:hypothetical protein
VPASSLLLASPRMEGQPWLMKVMIPKFIEYLLCASVILSVLPRLPHLIPTTTQRILCNFYTHLINALSQVGGAQLGYLSNVT